MKLNRKCIILSLLTSNHNISKIDTYFIIQKMISFGKLLLLTIIFASVSAVRIDDRVLTFNTSASKYVVSTSIATTFDKQFEVYCPLLISNKQSTTKFTVTESKKKLTIEPKFVQDGELLYNDYHEGQYWYGFKKQFNPELKDTTATFGLSKITYNFATYVYLLPLFNLPLSFININNLYRCHNVLISYQKTDKLADLTIFSHAQSWHLFPQATWGFRNKDEDINFSRQTYPLGTKIEIDIGNNKFCNLSQDIEPNSFELVQKQIYTLDDLLTKYSRQLQVKTQVQNEEL